MTRLVTSLVRSSSLLFSFQVRQLLLGPFPLRLGLPRPLLPDIGSGRFDWPLTASANAARSLSVKEFGQIPHERVGVRFRASVRRQAACLPQ